MSKCSIQFYILAINLRGFIFLSKSLTNLISKGPRTKLALDYDHLTFLDYNHSSRVQSIKMPLPQANISPSNLQRYHMRTLSNALLKSKYSGSAVWPLMTPLVTLFKKEIRLVWHHLSLAKPCHSFMILVSFPRGS